MPLLGVVALDKGTTLLCEPRLDQGHACSPESKLFGRWVNNQHTPLETPRGQYRPDAI
jgi:hypothetical protein